MPGDNNPVTPTDAPPLRNRFKAALALGGDTVASWARGKDRIESLVWMNLSGARYTADIRTDIATVLSMSVDELDAEIAAQRADSAEEGAV